MQELGKKTVYAYSHSSGELVLKRSALVIPVVAAMLWVVPDSATAQTGGFESDRELWNSLDELSQSALVLGLQRGVKLGALDLAFQSQDETVRQYAVVWVTESILPSANRSTIIEVIDQIYSDPKNTCVGLDRAFIMGASRHWYVSTGQGTQEEWESRLESNLVQPRQSAEGCT